MIFIGEMVRNIILGDRYSDREKVLLLKKLLDPSQKVDVYTERLAGLCGADGERERERVERRREQNRQAQRRRREGLCRAGKADGGEETGLAEASGEGVPRGRDVSNVSKCQQMSAMSAMSAAVSKADADGGGEKGGGAQRNAPAREGACGGRGAHARACARGAENIYNNIYTEPIPIPNRPDTRACEGEGAREEAMPSPGTMDDGELTSGIWPAVAILKAALGRGCWRRAVEQLGETEVLGEFGVFRAELRAGEAVENRAAAFTARLVKAGYSAKNRRER